MSRTFPSIASDLLEPSHDPLHHRLIAYLKAAGLASGAHITEQQVADALGVSRTPARRMLSALEDLGIVEARPKRGFFLLVPSEALFEPAIELPVTDDTTLFNRIALDRLSGNIADEFGDRDIIGLYGVSRRMTQRVMADLRAESLIDPIAPGRYRFNQALLDPEASDASYRFRLVLEPAIPLQPGFNLAGAALQRAREAHEKFLAMPVRERSNRVAYRIDADFHEMIAEGAQNPHFRSAVAQQNRLRQLMEYRDYNNMQRVETWCREHLTILAALEAGDVRRASKLIETHLRRAMAYRSGRSRSLAARSRVDD